MKLTTNTVNSTNNVSTARLTIGNTNVEKSILTLGNVTISTSQITVGNTTVNPSFISTPSIVLGGVQFGGGHQGGIVDYQEFTANGTWTNPKTLLIQSPEVEQGLTYTYYTQGSVSSPTTTAGLDSYFEASTVNPTVTYKGTGVYSGSINWGDSSQAGAGGTAGTKPSYLPSAQYSWMVQGYLLAPETGNYTFGVDSDDASDVFVNGILAASWYGGHGFSGTWSGNTGGSGQVSNTISLVANTYYTFRARMQEGSGSDGIQVGWQKPSDGSIALIPANAFFYGTVTNKANSLTGYEPVLVMMWGGGGGGSANSSWGGGGGGGACFVGTLPLNAFANTCAVTVGLGGAGTLSGTAASGGTSSFVINSSATVYAYGGSGTTIATNMGAGGGLLGAASGATGGAPLGGTIGNPAGSSTFGGGGGGNSTANYIGGSSIFGGAGAYNATSIYGGGVSGGPTTFGGAGGVYATTPAQAPGGGGTYFLNDTVSSSGARGEVRVWTLGHATLTTGPATYSLTANTTTLYEGLSVLYTVSTTNIANGTTLYYTLNNSSTATSADFTTAVNGSIIINDSTANFVLTANNDTKTANEAFQIDIRTNSSTGTIVASNSSVSIIPIV